MIFLKVLPIIVVLSLLDGLAPAGQGSGPAVDVSATLVTPDGKPAAKGKVALVEVGRLVEIVDGDLDENQTRCPIERTDEGGRFHFAAAVREFWLVVVHPSGEARVQCSRDSIPKKITLTPWARVEGTYRVARKPKPGVEIEIGWHQYLGSPAAHLYIRNRQITDATGGFVFERVIPGRGGIGHVRARNLGDPSETTSFCRRDASFVSGRTTRVEFGATGRPVTGRLKRPITAPEVPWSQAYINVRPTGRLHGDELAFTAAVANNGEFWVDDVPIGKYSLFVRFRPVGGGWLPAHPFEVPSINEKLWQKPVDLGVLQLIEDPITGGKAFNKK
ncbi:MAG TPA: hypothetical protein VGP76_32000 [Planctomycetaceae bacterium]|jgi:hypothetical protein|nr:hypothetical protein [Planctomycetaceae bacterium]